VSTRDLVSALETCASLLEDFRDFLIERDPSGEQETEFMERISEALEEIENLD